MSLLMDALKRAELAKQKGQGDGAADLSLEPGAITDDGGTPETLPSLDKLEDLDEEFLSHSADSISLKPTAMGSRTQSRERTAGDRVDEQEAVRNTFSAKNGIPKDRRLQLAMMASILLLLGGVGMWLWLQLKPAPTPMVARSPERQDLAGSRSELSAPVPPSLSASRISPGSEPSSVVPAYRAEGNVNPDSTATRRTSRPQPPVSPAPALPNDAAIRVTTSHASISSSIEEGYRLLREGDLVSARKAYDDALRLDPRNSDALLGLAALALQQGRTDVAESAYRQVLEANPADASAQAGLIGLISSQDPVAAESRLKSLLATQGDQPVVNFALGNLYARQQRWNEAQQAYFKAVTGDAGNAEYLFNLAVSLDQIHQPKLAAQYYSQALAAAGTKPVAFDTNAATRRLRELQN